MLADLEQKVKSLKNQAVERGFMTEDWQVDYEKPEPEPKELKTAEPPAIKPLRNRNRNCQGTLKNREADVSKPQLKN